VQVICDIETDALADPKNVWVAVILEVKTGEVHVFRDKDTFAKFARGVTVWVGHNFLTYDMPVLADLWGVVIDPRNVIDTLVISRLIQYSLPGGHSLANWGRIFKYEKDLFDDFTQWSQELEDRCVQDCRINLKVYQRFERFIKDPEWAPALRTEHDIARILWQQQKDGFSYNKKEADVLATEIRGECAALEHSLAEAFPKVSRIVREITPKETKHGTLHRADFRWMGPDPVLDGFATGIPFSVIRWEHFNPGSPKQVVERLDQAGWKPTERTTSGGSWKVNEANLATLKPDAPPAAQTLVRWLLLSARERRLAEWGQHYDTRDGRIHGKITHIGCWTQRCAHSAPNMGNVPSLNSKYGGEELKQLAYDYGKRMRSLWTASPNLKLVGCDAEGIQLRLFAHFVDNSTFTTALISGNQEDGTDAHTLNARALGEGISRAQAKTFIYAFLLGAGVGKTAAILGVSMGEAQERRERFLDSYPGLRNLRENRIPADIRRGYFVGLDGRKVHIPENKREGNVDGFILGAYLQNGEAVVMKSSNIIWRKDLDRQETFYRQLNFVHDEWQTEAQPDEAETVGRVQASSISGSTDRFGLLCPMAGTYKVGENWFETH